MENIFWTAYSTGDRLTELETIKQTVAGYGDIVDYHMYSDISMAVTIEIAEYKIDALYDALQQVVSMDAVAPLHSQANRERTVFLNISFAKGTGQLRVEVPSVPG
jgi:hypothetical protein